MTFKGKVVTVFGGTGFIGRQVVRDLARLGMTIRIATRQPQRAYFLQPCGTVGQITPLIVDYSNPHMLGTVISGSDYVVNCIGVLHEKKNGDFTRLHTELPGTLAKIAKDKGVSRFVHISALGIEKSQARYARSKLEGEKRVRSAFPEATIFRPSVVFGPDDSFFNRFASMARFLPALPLIGGGKTRFQPVYVGDVANAVEKALTCPATGDRDPTGKVFELGGPETLSFREIYERLFDATGRRRFLLPLPWPVAKMQAALMKLLPNPPLTPDQVELLKTDNLVSENANTLADLDLKPTGMSLIMNEYLKPYRKTGWRIDKNNA